MILQLKLAIFWLIVVVITLVFFPKAIPM